MANSLPPVIKIELMTLSLGVDRPCILHDHCIVGSTLASPLLLYVDGIELCYLRVVGSPVIFELLCSTLTVWLGGGVEGRSDLGPKLVICLAVAFRTIHRMQQPSVYLQRSNQSIYVLQLFLE